MTVSIITILSMDSSLHSERSVLESLLLFDGLLPSFE